LEVRLAELFDNDAARMKKPADNSLSQPNHKDAKDLAQGAFVNYLGMLAKVSKVIFLLVVVRVYGVTALGLYLLAWSAIDIASKFGLWGIDRSLIRDIARYNVDKSEQIKEKIFGILRFNISIAISLSLVATLVMFNLSSVIALKIFKESGLITPMKILSLALPFVVLTHVFIATTKALRTMRYEVLIRQTLEPLILLLATVALIPLSLGAVGLVFAHLFASFIAACTAAFVMFRKYRHLGWRREPLPAEIKKATIRYTYPMAIMEFLNLMVARMDILLIGAFLNSTSAGVYGIAVEIISVIKRVRQGFEPIFSPIVSELFYNRQNVRLQRNYQLVTRWLMAGTLLPVVAIILYPTQLLVLFDEKAAAASGALIILALSHGLLGTFIGAESLIIMTGKSLLNTIFVAGMLAINLVVSVLLIPKFGLIGAALGMLCAYGFVSGARLFHAYKHYNLHPFGYSLLWPLITALATFILFYVVDTLLSVDSLFKTIAVLATMGIFYAGFYFLGASEPEERLLIEKLKNKLKRTHAVQRTRENVS